MTTQWDETTDVIVVGSGGAGLSAALAARCAGAEVCVLEASGLFGGTTSMSGGVVWIPGNHLMADVGASDSREQALTYLEAMSLGRTERVLLETYVDEGPQVIRFLEKETPLALHALKFPDYHPEFPGGTFGRSLMPDVFDARTLGEYRPKLRMSPHFPVPISLLDMERAGADGVLSDMDAILPSEEIVARMTDDKVASGTALAAGLLKAAIDKGVVLKDQARVKSLIVEDGVVTGVSVEIAGKTVRLGARRGVVLASGGYERNKDLVRDFIRGPLEAPIGASSNRGDGLLMAMEIGAAIGNMSEAWWIPVLQIPGEEYEGEPFFRLATNERAMPGAIMVNGQGKRFVNEAHNYNDIGRAFHTFDPMKFDFVNLPAWIVLHRGRLDRSAWLTRFPSDPIPNWLISAPTIRELAGKIGVDPDALEATVARFNANATEGVDPDFHRGSSAYDLFHGDGACEGARQTLGPLDQAPFYAMRVYSGTLGTKGGPKTNARAEVLNVRGGVIPGLYAAGNAMAGVTGMGYPGAGGTLGPALVFGHIAGRTAATAGNRF
jgi:succinate dehydrogenase/fumarate reductase flavoprotein subunit